MWSLLTKGRAIIIIIGKNIEEVLMSVIMCGGVA